MFPSDQHVSGFQQATADPVEQQNGYQYALWGCKPIAFVTIFLLRKKNLSLFLS